VNPAETVRRLAEEVPDVVRLAEEVSLAVQVDPALLRRARLDLVPCASAGTEADLWFSPLVRSRSPAGFVLMPELAAELRRRLARDPVRLAAARARVERAHAHLAPALHLEEELLWLSVRPDAGTHSEIEGRLQTAIAALVRDGRDGIAHWAARALPALPTEVQSLEFARILDAGARLRLEGAGSALAALAEDPTTRSAGWMVPNDFPTTIVRVRLREDGIELAARDDAPGHAIQVPSTDPLLIEVHWRDVAEDAAEASGRRTLREAALASFPASTWIPITRGGVARIAGPVFRGVRVRTISGHTYEVHQLVVLRGADQLDASIPTPRPADPESLFLEHLDWINRVAAMTSKTSGISGAEAEDFAAFIRMKIIEDDYAIIRNHRGESKLRTYLATVVQRQFQDYLHEKRGRWRPSAAARRLGPPAPDLEALVYRDGLRLDQAGEKLRTSGRTTLSDRELGRVLKELPAREPMRPKEIPPENALDDREAGEQADDWITTAEAEARAEKRKDALERAMARLAPEDRTILRMHFADGRSLAHVARALQLEQKPLYRRVNRLRTQLRTYLEEEGISGFTIQDMGEEGN
jgi:RNA polymerase sigma factor (sigma-70 family)